MYGWGHDWLGMGWFGGILMVLFWVAVVAGIVLLVRAVMREGNGRKTDPMEILKERYARGEISTQEFEERKKTLTGG